MFEDSVASYDEKIAMIMAAGDAAIEDASLALAECDGDMEHALALLYGHQSAPIGSTISYPIHNSAPYKPSRKVCRKDDVDDESIAKPPGSLMYAPSVVAHDATKDPKETGKNGSLNRRCSFLCTCTIMSHEYVLSLQGNSVTCACRSVQLAITGDNNACPCPCIISKSACW